MEDDFEERRETNQDIYNRQKDRQTGIKTGQERKGKEKGIKRRKVGTEQYRRKNR